MNPHTYEKNDSFLPGNSRRGAVWLVGGPFEFKALDYVPCAKRCLLTSARRGFKVW